MPYKVYRNGVLVATTANTTYTDTGLTPGTLYSYSVSELDDQSVESAQTQSLMVYVFLAQSIRRLLR